MFIACRQPEQELVRGPACGVAEGEQRRYHWPCALAIALGEDEEAPKRGFSKREDALLTYTSGRPSRHTDLGRGRRKAARLRGRA